MFGGTRKWVLEITLELNYFPWRISMNHKYKNILKYSEKVYREIENNELL